LKNLTNARREAIATETALPRERTGGWESNVRFYRIQCAYGMGAVRAGVRFLGVTISWFAWFKWRG